MLKAHKEKRNTIYLLGYVKIRVYNIVHNPILSYRREKKNKKKDAYENTFWPNLILCFHFLLQKAYVLSYFCQALF